MSSEDSKTSEEAPKSLKQKISEIPCYRSSLLNGVGGGLAVGLAHFMLSSNPRRSANIGFASYLGITVLAFAVCRYRWSSSHVDEVMIKRALNQKILSEGTPL